MSRVHPVVFPHWLRCSSCTVFMLPIAVVAGRAAVGLAVAWEFMVFAIIAGVIGLSALIDGATAATWRFASRVLCRAGPFGPQRPSEQQTQRPPSRLSG